MNTAVPINANTQHTQIFSLDPSGVVYGRHAVSDQELRTTLQSISEHLGAKVILTSGDRHSIVNGNKKSHHLEGRAADFYVEGYSLESAYAKIKKLPEIQEGYQLILHSTLTKAPHLHLGRYPDERPSSFIVDNGHILGRR